MNIKGIVQERSALSNSSTSTAASSGKKFQLGNEPQPVGPEPVRGDPITDPVSNPISPIGVRPVGPEPVKGGPVRDPIEPVGPEPVGPEPIKGGPVRDPIAEPIGVNPQPVGPEPITGNPVSGNPIGSPVRPVGPERPIAIAMDAGGTSSSSLQEQVRSAQLSSNTFIAK